MELLRGSVSSEIGINSAAKEAPQVLYNIQVWGMGGPVVDPVEIPKV